jgi:hypothetical protein
MDVSPACLSSDQVIPFPDLKRAIFFEGIRRTNETAVCLGYTTTAVGGLKMKIYQKRP